MNLKLTALPILVLLISVSTIALVNGDSSTETTSAGTTSTLHVDAGNGNFFDIPYSISGATVTDIKADASIPKVTISISATTDGQITLQVPGGESNSASQNDFTVLVDGQNSQYTQSYYNGHRMITISFHANSSTIEIVGAHATNAQNTQSSVSCPQDEITNAKQGIGNIREKMGALQMQYHNEWQTAYNSGQYNGTWQQYMHEKLWNSPDVSQLKSDYQKFSSVLRSCGVNTMYSTSYPSSTTCSQDDINHARQELVTTEKQGYELKNKIYQQFQQGQASGQFNGTWAQYAQENFWNSPEVSQLKSTHEKYSSFLKSCFGKQTIPPQSLPPSPSVSGNLQENTTATLPPTPYQDIPSINPTDAQAIAAGHGIPGWVKQIVGWWVEGKISDSEFVTVIKFLIHQGIIQP